MDLRRSSFSENLSHCLNRTHLALAAPCEVGEDTCEQGTLTLMCQRGALCAPMDLRGPALGGCVEALMEAWGAVGPGDFGATEQLGMHRLLTHSRSTHSEASDPRREQQLHLLQPGWGN